MLTIPNSIKNLYRTDGTRKNFRVQFPNNELPDITNDNIVRESVHFTESICSQSTFRFGLAEASVIEFETVGIGNMYGMTISCAYEIDTSSLSAAEISAIQSDPGDGELVLASASDIGYGFYRIPLGVFRVEKCPRNHGTMTHRQVTAYQYPNFNSLELSPIQNSILGARNLYSPFTLDLYAFVYGNLGFYSSDVINALYTRSVKVTDPMENVTRTETYGVPLGTYQLKITYTQKVVWITVARSEIIGYSDAGFPVDDLNETLDYVGETYSITDSIIQSAKEDLVNVDGGSVWSQGTNLSDVYAFYPWDGRDRSTEAIPLSFLSNVVMQVIRRSTSEVIEEWTFSGNRTPVLYTFTPNATYPSIVLSLSPSGSYVASGVTYYTYLGAVDFPKLLAGFYETSGRFGKADRLGGVEDFALSPSSPLAISPGDYDEVWWDEYDVSPIGTVTVTYRNGEEGEATANVTLGAGASLYDMTDNEVLKNLSTADLDSITTLLSGDFATNAQNVGFTPIEMTMQGWPWMEAGDALQITAEDGTVVNTYALRVEMSGIQHLMSDITAEGGEIIGEV